MIVLRCSWRSGMVRVPAPPGGAGVSPACSSVTCHESVKSGMPNVPAVGLMKIENYSSSHRD